MRYYLLSTALWCAFFLRALPAFALTIDEFGGEVFIQPQRTQPTNFALLSDGSALGGTRSIEGRVTDPVTAGGGDMFVQTFGGAFSHSQDSNISGYSLLTWDGDVAPGFLTKSGLGGIDFLQDNATAIAIEIIFFDYPNAKPLTLAVTLYDTDNPLHFSTGSVILNSAVITTPGNPQQFQIPFGSFVTAPGATGPADLTRIGAVTLRIGGDQAPAADLELAWFGTNGICRTLPDSEGKVIDQCGVCAGDGTSCLDCAGQPFGTAVLDRCGICQGDGNSCITCRDQDIRIISATMDGGAKKLEAAIKKAAQKLGFYKKDKATQKYIAKTLAEVHRLQITNWTLSWVFPTTMTICNNETFCAVTSYQSTADEYRTHNREMLGHGREVINRLKKIGKKQADIAKSMLKPIERQYQLNLAESYVVPIKDFTC
jgi:hypothetical protein